MKWKVRKINLVSWHTKRLNEVNTLSMHLNSSTIDLANQNSKGQEGKRFNRKLELNVVLIMSTFVEEPWRTSWSFYVSGIYPSIGNIIVPQELQQQKSKPKLGFRLLLVNSSQSSTLNCSYDIILIWDALEYALCKLI